MPVPVNIFIEKLYFFRNYNYASIICGRMAESNCNLFLWKENGIFYDMKFWGFLVNEETSQLNFAQTCCLISNSSSFMLYFFSQLCMHVHLKLCAIGILVKTHFLTDLNLALMHEYISTHTCELSWSQFICCH